MDRKVKDPGRRRTTRISAKNQVTLPVAALGAAQLRAGAVVTIEAQGRGCIVVRSVDRDLDDVAGTLPGVWPSSAIEDLRNEWD